MLIGGILLALGVFYLMRRSKIAPLTAYNYPTVPPIEFDRWRRYEMLSIDIFLAATWGNAVLGFVAVFLVPSTPSSGYNTGLAPVLIVLCVQIAAFFLGLIVSAVFGSTAAGIRKRYQIQLP
jgi:hypothetical protein